MHSLQLQVVQAAELPLKQVLCEPDNLALDAMVGRVQTRSGQLPGPPRRCRKGTESAALKNDVMPPGLKDPATWEQNLLNKQEEVTDEQVKDIGEYLTPSYSRFQRRPVALIEGNDRLSLFYRNFVNTAKHLNIDQLNEAVRFDTHFGHIYDKCVQ